ncbi:MAG: hypothetical protein K1W03_08200 [Mailhella sp.]
MTAGKPPFCVAAGGYGAQGKGLCVMEMCITAYSVMENAVHSTWKSKVQLSHVLQTAFPTTP